MENCKPIPTPVATGTKLSKDDKGADVNPTLSKDWLAASCISQ